MYKSSTSQSGKNVLNPYQPSRIEPKFRSKGALERRRDFRNEIIGFFVASLVFLPFEYVLVRNMLRQFFGI